MASQRITIAKISGLGGDIALQRLAAWSSARNAADANCWCPEQWPDRIRQEGDDFAVRLRAHGLALPVCYFGEWADRWSTGNLFSRWLTPPNGPGPLWVYANQFEIFAYALPDEGRLARYLGAAGPQQFEETNWFIARLQEAVGAWDEVAPRATIVVLRYVVDGSTLDEDATASLNTLPQWLS